MPRPHCVVCVFALVVGALIASGCVGHNVINPVADGERGFSNPNSDPIPPLMIEAVRWVATRYPPEESAEWSVGAASRPRRAWRGRCGEPSAGREPVGVQPCAN